jgi:hypothetical protein
MDKDSGCAGCPAADSCSDVDETSKATEPTKECKCPECGCDPCECGEDKK